MRRLVAALSIGALAAAPMRAQSAHTLEALWYATGTPRSVQSFLGHAGQISVVSPQVFAYDSDGVITGKVDQRMLDAARAKHVRMVPLVMNPGFSQPLIHRLLTVPAARDRAIASLVSLCRDNHFDGLQFDIENVNVSDRDALTSFMRDAATALHAIHCEISAAVVPRTSDTPGSSSYDRWIFDNWRGAYDYKALAQSLDFISFMTYAQHTGGTTAGPVAGYTWMKQSLDYLLSLGVPRSRISLGIPSYSDWWYPTYTEKDGARQRGSDVGFATADSLLRAHHVRPVWDDREKTAFAIWPVNGVNELLWIENARAFAAKLALAKRYRLRGYSVWVLGLEDPAVWAALPRTAR